MAVRIFFQSYDSSIQTIKVDDTTGEIIDFQSYDSSIQTGVVGWSGRIGDGFQSYDSSIQTSDSKVDSLALWVLSIL